jgi:hypothetical protein
MSNVFRNVTADNRTAQALFPASVANEIGDLLWYNSSTARAARASAVAPQGSEALDQAYFSARCYGVAMDQRLATETDDGAKRLILISGVVDLPCVSASFVPGDLVGPTRGGGAALLNQQVVKVANRALAFGVVYFAQASVTTVRFFFQSQLCMEISETAVGLGTEQGTGSKALSDAAYAVLVSDNPILTMAPTAAPTDHPAPRVRVQRFRVRDLQPRHARLRPDPGRQHADDPRHGRDRAGQGRHGLVRRHVLVQLGFLVNGRRQRPGPEPRATPGEEAQP